MYYIHRSDLAPFMLVLQIRFERVRRMLGWYISVHTAVDVPYDQYIHTDISLGTQPHPPFTAVVLCTQATSRFYSKIRILFHIGSGR